MKLRAEVQPYAENDPQCFEAHIIDEDADNKSIAVCGHKHRTTETAAHCGYALLNSPESYETLELWATPLPHNLLEEGYI